MHESLTGEANYARVKMERISIYNGAGLEGGVAREGGLHGQIAGGTMEEKRNEVIHNTDSEKEMPVCCQRIKHRDEKEYRDLLNRLKRIEGQVRGLQGMVEDDRYCIDILTQVSAVQSALNSFNKKLLTNHIKSCVVEDIAAGKENAVEELCTTIQRIMK